MFTSLPRCLRRDSGRGSAGRLQRQGLLRGPAPRGRSFAPRLESLEDRTVPSTLLVENLLDSGPGSLRQAVLDANGSPGADTIAFAPQLQGTIALSSGQLSITDDLTIDGPGAERLAISGDNPPAFQGDSGITVALAQLTITGGRAAEGAGVFNGGILTVSHSVFSDNQALGGSEEAGRGGGIFNAAGATVTVLDSTFTGNQAVGGVDAVG